MTFHVIAAALLGAATAAGSDVRPAALAGLTLPAGWVNTEDYTYYTEENLYSYINGESETFYPYGFALLTLFHVHPKDDPEAAVAIDLYRLGSPLDAFGIYSTYRVPGDTFVDVGTEGFVGTTQLVFYQEDYFVKVRFVQPKGDRDDLLAIGKAVSAVLPEHGPPEALKLVDVPGLVEHSIVYEARDVMGYAFFERGLQASVKREEEDGEPLRVYVLFFDGAEEAEAALSKYLEDLALFDVEYTWEEQSFGKVLVIKAPEFERGVLCRIGDKVVRVGTAPAAPEAAFPHLERLVKNVRTKSEPG